MRTRWENRDTLFHRPPCRVAGTNAALARAASSLTRATRGCLAAAAALAVLAAPAAQAKVLWQGDFETGDVSQWTKQQSMGADRLEVVSDPVAQGRYALKARVLQGDDPINASGNRNELVQLTMEGEGDERWYKWSTMWPDDYASVPHWQLFTQFHHEGANGSPPVEMFVNGENVVLRVNGKDVWTTPLQRGAWHDFVLHVLWSSSDTEGFVELYYDGQRVLEPVPAATLFPGQKVYMKQGLYRHASITQPQVVYHDGMTVSDTPEDVLGGSSGSAGDVYTEGAPITLSQPGSGGSCASAGLGMMALAPMALWALRRRRRS